MSRCRWCDREISGDVCERCEWEDRRESFVSVLRSSSEISGVIAQDRVVDWVVGSRDEWPSLHRDGEIDVVSSSSLSIGFLPQDPPAVREIVIHLPPIPLDETSQIEPFWDSDRLLLGSRSARYEIEDIATPHVIAEKISWDEAEDLVSSSIDCYREIYQDSDLIIKTDP